MARAKQLKQDKMKLLGLIFVLLFITVPAVRYNTGTALHTAANIIQGK